MLNLDGREEVKEEERNVNLTSKSWHLRAEHALPIRLLLSDPRIQSYLLHRFQVLDGLPVMRYAV